MITIILPISDVPDGMTVRKPTGSKPHTVRDQAPVYDANGQKVEINTGDTKCLVTESGVNVYLADYKVAIDCLDIHEAIDFLDRVQDDYL